MARILIAEDDPLAREVIARICEFKGHHVEQSPDALQALEAFRRQRPDLLITDLAMPMGGGQYLVREVRTTPDGRSVPVIVITGYASLLGPRERDDLQPCTILEKPLELAPMFEALEAALG